MTVLTYLFAGVAVVLATARITRVLVFDDFPPTKWIRTRWDSRTEGSGWNELFHCPYCMGVWVGLVFTVIAAGLLVGWGIFGTITGLWWVFCAWMAVSYLAGIVVATNWG